MSDTKDTNDTEETKEAKEVKEVRNDTCITKGRRGEINTYVELVNWPGPPDAHYVLQNLYLPNPGGKTTYTQIDLIYLHTSGIYMIEVKDWLGRIYVDEKQDGKWNRVTPDWTGNKYDSLGSPLRQNERHEEALRKLLEDESKELPVHHIAVFSDARCRIIRLDYPWEKTVVYLRDLRAAIECIARENQNRLLPDQVQNLYEQLRVKQNPPEEIVKQHIKEVEALKSKCEGS